MSTRADSATGSFLPHGPVTVTAVCVTYNSEADLPQLLSSLRREAVEVPMRVVVADNSSSDGSLALARSHRDVVAVGTGGNLGYAAGLNVALRHVGDTEAVLVLNPDLTVWPGAVPLLVEEMRRSPDTGIVVPRILDDDGNTSASVRREPGLLGAAGDALLGRRWPGRPGALSEQVRSPDWYEVPHEIDWATGAALLVAIDCVRAVGAWDEQFFLYSEETDYFRRARSRGWKARYLPTARVVHRGGGSGVSDELIALTLVNRVRYVEKHRPRSAPLYRGIVIVAEQLRRRDHSHDRARWALWRRTRWGELPGPVRDAPRAGTFEGVSVIIPAHDEAQVIGATLDPLAPLAASGELEVVVVCNGCQDRTAQVARTYAGVTVLEVDTASKTAALNAGDAVARGWPRVYLDADIVVRPRALGDVVEELRTGRALAARPTARVSTSQSRALVRSYYRARERMPRMDASLWGAGVYALSREGHSRLGRFPSVTGDDLFVDRLFTDVEKAVVATDAVLVQAPHTAGALLHILTRARRGTADQAVEDGRSTVRELRRTVTGPGAALDALVYAGFAALARLRSRGPRSTQTSPGWERDDTSRQSPARHPLTPADVDHVVCTRFNLPSAGRESLVRAREGWLHDRVALFEKYTVPSMRRQTADRFTWIVYLDEASPAWLVERLQPLADEGLCIPLFRECVTWRDVARDARELTGARRPILLTTNLDNDDGLAPDFLERLQSLAAAHPRTALFLTRGLVVDGDRLFLRHDRDNAFCSVSESWDAPATAWRDFHTNLHHHFPVVRVGGPPAWLQVVHGRNVSNRVRGRRVAPDRYRASFGELLDGVRRGDRRGLLLDHLVLWPTRGVRESAIATAKTAILRTTGPDGLEHLKTRVERIRDRLAGHSAVRSTSA